jgi:RNA polymerase I-specific transcription initiation factor RRN6
MKLMDSSLEFAGKRVEIPDVDEASASLQELLHVAGQDEAFEIRHIAAAHLLNLGKDEQPTISGLYDSILETWIAPLPAEVSARVRKRKERLARRIAAEVMLAGTRVLHRESQTNVVERQLLSSQDNGVLVPILSSQPLQSSPSKWTSSQPLSSPPLSLPHTQSSLPLNTTSFSSRSQMSSQRSQFTNPVLTDPLARLSKHLQFREEVASTLPVPENVNRVLAHWQPGADPRLYDWSATERAERVEEIDESSQKELEKAQKRKVRRERKQKRENELMQAQSSSQPFIVMPPPAFPRSSPGPLLGPIGSSSQVPSQPFAYVPSSSTGFQSQGGFGPFVAQSQVEPGKFGGRPDKKKKKKGRISGF